MGHVYRAWDARLHREVAIKLLHDEFAMPGMRERFLREARAASALNHPNICTIFDIGEQDGEPYLVMELLEGETLRDRIQERSMKTDELICIAKEAAEALGAAHAKGIIHRDVKPANIFLVDRPNAMVQTKVLDFGLAKIEGGVLGARGGRSVDITTAGSTVGTLAYMSPEQARGETLDSRSDLFSLGVVLYEMATRHVPFQGATSALVFVKLLNHPPEPVRDWNEAIPRDLEKIIFKLMAKERTARFQTAQEVVEALSDLNDKQSGGGGWLRKAVSTVPLVRAPDPVARDRRTGNRKNSEAFQARGRENATPTPTPAPGLGSADPSPRPSSDAPMFLRPVARMPKSDSARVTPVPSADVVAVEPAPPVVIDAGPVPPPVAARAEAKVAPADVEVVEAGDLIETPSGTFTERKPRSRGGFQWTPLTIASVVLLLLLIAGIVYFLMHKGRFGPTMLTEDDSLVVTEIENRTGDKMLDGTLAQGLQIALEQSPYLRLRSQVSYGAALHQRSLEGGEVTGLGAARDAAKRMSTTAYLIGSIRGTTPPYVLHIDMRNTQSNDVMSSFEERVASLQEVTGALDRLAVDLRSGVGEDGDTISKASVPLAREATPDVEALHAYSLGETALAGNKPLDAVKLFQEAIALEPRFALAQLELAINYRRERAEVAAADSSKLALAAADGTSERTRTLAQYEYEMDVSGDYNRAAGLIHQLTTNAPRDVEALELLSKVLRLQGHLSEALQPAQQAYLEDPYAAEAYTQAENALMGLDRYDAAFQLENQAERAGMATTGGTLTSAYLEGRQAAVDTALAGMESSDNSFQGDWAYGIYLDNTGRLQTSAAVWQGKADAAKEVTGMESAAASLLAQGALDHALAGDCAGGLAMARGSDDLPQGTNALFNTGMAHALCGSTARAREIVADLQKNFPQSFAATGFYIPDLQAALALHDGDPASALEALKPARQYDMISLTPYLRGRAHVALRQTQIGIVDYQTVLAHRGSALLTGGDVYPIAEIGVARAFADTGDLGNSAQAYRHFLDLWRNADPGQMLVAEAQTRAQQPALGLPGK